MLLRGAMKQEKLYLQSLEREDMFAVPADIGAAVDTQGKSKKAKKKPEGNETAPEPNNSIEAKALKQTVAGIRELVGKMQTDLPFAKRDISYGKLDAEDLKRIFSHIRGCLIPIIGLSTVIDVFQRIAEGREWITNQDTPPDILAEKNEEKRIWNEVMKQLHQPFEDLSEAIDQGLEHAGTLLEILPKAKRADDKNNDGENGMTADVEAKGDLVRPGDSGFAKDLEEKMKKIHVMKDRILRVWAKERGLSLETASAKNGIDDVNFSVDDTKHRRDQAQLFVLLYIEKLVGYLVFSSQRWSFD